MTIGFSVVLVKDLTNGLNNKKASIPIKIVRIANNKTCNDFDCKKCSLKYKKQA